MLLLLVFKWNQPTITKNQLLMLSQNTEKFLTSKSPWCVRTIYKWASLDNNLKNRFIEEKFRCTWHKPVQPLVEHGHTWTAIRVINHINRTKTGKTSFQWMPKKHLMKSNTLLRIKRSKFSSQFLSHYLPVLGSLPHFTFFFLLFSVYDFLLLSKVINRRLHPEVFMISGLFSL